MGARSPISDSLRKEMAKYRGQGLNNIEIGKIVGYSPAFVRTHLEGVPYVKSTGSHAVKPKKFQKIKAVGME